MADYQAVKVGECWVVRPEMGTVEVLALTAADGVSSTAVYGAGEAVQSVVFAGLTAATADIFAA